MNEEMMNFTTDELLSVLIDQEEQQSPGLTTKELAMRLNKSIDWVHEKLGEKIKAGLVECVWIRRTGIDNRMHKIPGYRRIKKVCDAEME